MRMLNKADIRHIYQPMWNLDGWEIFGYEALMRISNRANVEIEKVFIEARMEGRLFELDTIAIESAIRHFPLQLLKKGLLFINIFPSTLMDERFLSFVMNLIDKYSIRSENIVFELNETIEEEHKWDLPGFKDEMAALRNLGFKIALDDIGKGAATIQKIVEFSPDYIKLDRYFSENLSTSKEKQEMIKLLIEYAKQKMGLILEGIENDVDLAYAKMIHVPVAQGYLLGRPQRMDEPSGLSMKALNF